MSLKDKIQNEIIDETKKLSNILRKAVILAHRLKSEEFKSWVDQELNGYSADKEQLPMYRAMRVQTYGHFSGPFQSGLRNAPIPTAQFSEEIHEFATTQYFFQSIRELESMVESGDRTFNFQWPADFVVPIADKIYENMVCMQAWKIISVDQVEGIIDTVRNRLLSFVLEIEDIDPKAGESRQEEDNLSPDTVSQVFNNFILGSHNVVGSGTNVSLAVTQSVSEGDFESLAETLKSWGLENDDVRELSEAIDEDGARNKKDGYGKNVRNWIGKMIQKIISDAWDMAIETAPILLSKAISVYYGWN